MTRPSAAGITRLNTKNALAWSPYVIYFMITIGLLIWWIATESGLALVLLRFATPMGILLTFYYLPRLRRPTESADQELRSREGNASGVLNGRSYQPNTHEHTKTRANAPIGGVAFVIIAFAAGAGWLLLEALGVVSR